MPAVGALTVVLALLAGLAGLASAAPAQADGWTAPAYVRSVAARGNAGLYAWGMAYNPVTDEVIVGDYINYQLRRFDRQGNLLGSFYRPASQRKGHPESVAVDPRDGSIYTSDRSRDDQGYIAKFDKTGKFLLELKISASYHAWIAIDSAGYLYVSDSHVGHNRTRPPQVRKYVVDDATATATEVAHWGSWGTGPGQITQITGITVGPDGNVYTADTLNVTVHVWAPDGTWLRDIGGAGNGAGRFTGDLRGVAVSPDNRTLYVVDANGGQIERFDPATGASLGEFGGLGTGPGQFGDGGRQLTLDPAGNVWVADYGNTRIMEFGPVGGWLGSFPQPTQAAPPGSLSLPRDVAVDPATGDLWVIEMNNHRFQRFTADGTPVGTWGYRSSDRPMGLNYPRGIAVDPVSGRLWISNTNQDQIRVLNADLTYAFEVGGTNGVGLNQFKQPMDVEFYNGNAYVTDYAGDRLKVFDASTGLELWSIVKNVSGVTVDQTTGDIYATSWESDAIWHWNADGTPAATPKFASRGTGPGQLTSGWDIDLVNGVLYVTDSEQNKVVAYTTDGTYLGQWGSPGTKPGQFNNASGITHDAAGRLYVADAGNDRIQVFDPNAVLPADAAVPTVTLTTPTRSATLSTPATLTGTVSDDVRVGTVELCIQDQVTKLWWDGKVATWGKTKVFTTAGVISSDPTTGTWWFPLIGAAEGGSYTVQLRTTDASGRTSTPSALVPFTIERTTPLDTVAPDTTITAPAAGATLPTGLVTVSGQAADNVGVASTQVALQDRVTKKWWNAALAAWTTTQSWAPAAQSAPGAATTGWSWTWDEATAAGSHSYYVVTRGADAAGNVESVRPSVKFQTS